MQLETAIFELRYPAYNPEEGIKPGTQTWQIRLDETCANIPSDARLVDETTFEKNFEFSDAFWRHNTSGAHGTLNVGQYMTLGLPDGYADEEIPLDDWYSHPTMVSNVPDSILMVPKTWQDVPTTFSLSAGSGTIYLREGCTMRLFTMYTYDPTLHHDLYWYDGSKWKECDVFAYDGSQWKPCDVFQYDGTKWQSCAT